jgi:hypothetical protein
MRDTILALEGDLLKGFTRTAPPESRVLADPAFLQRLILEVGVERHPGAQAELLLPAELVSLLPRAN